MSSKALVPAPAVPLAAPAQPKVEKEVPKYPQRKRARQTTDSINQAVNEYHQGSDDDADCDHPPYDDDQAPGTPQLEPTGCPPFKQAKPKRHSLKPGSSAPDGLEYSMLDDARDARSASPQLAEANQDVSGSTEDSHAPAAEDLDQGWQELKDADWNDDDTVSKRDA